MNRSQADLQSRKIVWAAITRIMDTGGFLKSFAGSGPELARFRHFLAMLQGHEPDPRDANPPGPNDIDPWVLPPFPGLRNVPWPDPADYPWVAAMENGFESLRAEALRLRESFMSMSYASSNDKQESKWRQGFVSAFGTQIPRQAFAAGTVPEAAIALLESLNADDYAGFSHYPFADAFYSWLDPKFVVRGHHSADNFRVRCQLALDIPDDCYLKVAGEARTWQEGKALLLDDSFWHEAVNNSDRHRLVFLTDFWHPDLTVPERRALKAAFGRKEIRLLFMTMREVPQAIVDQFMPVFAAVDREDPEIAARWTAEPDISHIPELLARIRQLHHDEAQLLKPPQ
ncbi:MAG: aspartyl/asparaginyl beta-hydroxylase domain-containing protein [Acidobacteriota bacterium]|nr:aspartyl/asparaginyl beta-hydroxylase domain-containing protein [Acidobacteriota bacterium]